MKKVVYYLCFAVILGCVAMLNTSCTEKAKAINNLENLAVEVEKHGDTYGFTEWQDVFKQYQAINVVIDRHYGEYSQKQHNRINRAKSTIKSAAWDALQNKLDMFPALKQLLWDWYYSIFGRSAENAEN